MIQTTLDMLLIGTAKPFRENGEMSAICKQPVLGKIWLGSLGFEGNQVADLVNHGGRDKAVHLYPIEHYTFWRRKYPDVEILKPPGAFGENLSCKGMTEDRLCLGDVFRLGEALIECSHARQPCWKLNHHIGRRDVMKTVVKTAKSGSYFRVIEPGFVREGDTLIQQEQPLPHWSLERLFRLIIGGEHRDNKEVLNELSQKAVLAETWRKRAALLSS
ncbi:MAG: MOSC domain-containing protein [Verrucomicrobiales bacterium]|nr:MOSC domain-containing protein [Verrucomicrobiales bacterium]